MEIMEAFNYINTVLNPGMYCF